MTRLSLATTPNTITESQLVFFITGETLSGFEMMSGVSAVCNYGAIFFFVHKDSSPPRFLRCLRVFLLFLRNSFMRPVRRFILFPVPYPREHHAEVPLAGPADGTLIGPAVTR